MTGLDGVKPDSVCQQVNIGADYTEEEVEFLKVMDQYIRQSKRKFPTFVEILRLVKTLGYERVNNGHSYHQAGPTDDQQASRV